MGQSRTSNGLYFDAERREMQARDREMIPRKLVWAMFGLAGATLVLTSLSVLSGRPKVGVPPIEEAIASYEITLSGDGDAAHVVTSEGAVLLDTDQGAFVTVIKAGLNRNRRVHRIEGNPPVLVEEFGSGRWRLTDPATGWQVELSSFGNGNKAQFARLFN